MTALVDTALSSAAHYREFGYAVVRNVFGPAELRELAAAFDRVYAEAVQHPTSFRHQNVFYRIVEDPACGRIVRFAQWPSYFEPTLARFRTDKRLLGILEPLIGDNLKQIINQLHWKPPGAQRVEFGYHQDIHFRRPPEAYREPGASYVQTMIAVDAHRRENGAMTVYPGSHRLGALTFRERGRILEEPMSAHDLLELGLDPDGLVDLELDPGDVALWSLYTIHGSGPNRSSGDRRAYVNGYVRAENCDRGEWAFRNGAPCALGEPVIVHYEDLYARPEPHYVTED